MSGLTAAALSRLRGEFDAWMLNTCVHVTRQAALNDYGQQEGVWVDQLTYACGIDLTAGQMIRRPDQSIAQTDGTIRLPLSALDVVHAEDRIRLTYRNQEELVTPIEFAIRGEPRLGPLGLVTSLRRLP